MLVVPHGFAFSHTCTPPALLTLELSKNAALLSHESCSLRSPDIAYRPPPCIAGSTLHSRPLPCASKALAKTPSKPFVPDSSPNAATTNAFLVLYVTSRTMHPVQPRSEHLNAQESCCASISDSPDMWLSRRDKECISSSQPASLVNNTLRPRHASRAA